MSGGMSHTIGVLVKGNNALSSSLIKAEHSLTSFRKTAERTALSVNSSLIPADIDMGAVDKAASKMTGIGTKAMMVGGIVAAGLGLAVHAATGFDSAMAEVSTLVDTATTDMGALTSEVRSLSKEYGQMPVNTAGALYTTISAGYGDAADATVMLEGAMKLARGGITDTGTAIDGLTSIMNSYGMEANLVSGVSDQMFVAMKAGKTNIGELSSSLGKVTPLAAAAGVGLDHLLSATSALTLGGLSTSEAVTSLKGMLSAVIKPTSEATKTAKSLGIEFSSTAVKSMGLGNWLAHVKEKTGGNEEAMAKLFGPVEALSGVMALTGNQAESFSSILEQMGNSAGATDEAFQKVNASASAAFDRAKANAAVLVETVGHTLMPVVSSLADSFAWVSDKISTFAEVHPFLTKTVVILTAVTAGVLVVGGAALVMGAQVVTAMAMVNVSTGGILLVVGALITGITALTLLWTSAADDMNDSSSWVAQSWEGLRSVFYAMATPVAYGIGFLTGVVSNAWSTIASYTNEVWPMLRTVVLRAFSPLLITMLPGLALLKGVFVTTWGILGTLTEAVWSGIVLNVKTAWGMVSGLVSLGWNLISGLFKTGLQLLTGDWSGAWETVQTTFANVLGDIEGLFMTWIGWFTGLGSILMDSGTGLIDAFWEGIQGGWGTLIEGFTGLLGDFRGFLPFSDAKEGPLSQLTKSGSTLLPTFAAGIEKGADAPIKAVTSSLAEIRLDGPKIPPLRMESTRKNDRKGQNRSRTSDQSSVVFQKGAFQMTFVGADPFDDLEERMTKVFSNVAQRLGVSHA